jgi:hypothetical protein
MLRFDGKGLLASMVLLGMRVDCWLSVQAQAQASGHGGEAVFGDLEGCRLMVWTMLVRVQSCCTVLCCAVLCWTGRCSVLRDSVVALCWVGQGSETHRWQGEAVDSTCCLGGSRTI